MKRLKFLLPALVFIGLIYIFVDGLKRDPTLVVSPLIGKPAPEFRLPRLMTEGATLGTADMLGHYSLFNVWGTWCSGCRQEHPTLLRIAATGLLPIYGLNWKDSSSEARRWLQELGNPYVDNAVDTDGRVAIDWGVYGAPETFLLAPDGTVIYKQVGPLNWDIWQQKILPLVVAQRNTAP